MIRLVCLIVTISCLVGCFSLPVPSASIGSFRLLPPTLGPEASLLKQVVTMKFDQEQREFIAITRMDKMRIQVEALLPTGQSVFSLDYNGHKLIQKQVSDFKVPGEEILKIMQFTLWPEDTIKQYYRLEDGWTLEFSANKRSLKNNDQQLDVLYDNDKMVIDKKFSQKPRHYRVIIHTFEQQLL